MRSRHKITFEEFQRTNDARLEKANTHSSQDLMGSREPLHRVWNAFLYERRHQNHHGPPVLLFHELKHQVGRESCKNSMFNAMFSYDVSRCLYHITQQKPSVVILPLTGINNRFSVDQNNAQLELPIKSG